MIALVVLLPIFFVVWRMWQVADDVDRPWGRKGIFRYDGKPFFTRRGGK